MIIGAYLIAQILGQDVGSLTVMTQMSSNPDPLRNRLLWHVITEDDNCDQLPFRPRVSRYGTWPIGPHLSRALSSRQVT